MTERNAFSVFRAVETRVMDHTGEGRVRTADVVAPEPADTAGAAAGAGFEALCLPAAVLAGVHACGYTRPSPVQRAAIPPALAGADCIVQAKSGTGRSRRGSTTSRTTC